MPEVGAFSNYLENQVMNHILRNIPYTSPAAVYVALYTSDPTADNTGTEVSGGGYARQQVTFGAPTDGVVSNTADINFPVATADWGTITHAAIFDAATGGNMLIYGPLNAAKTISAGDQYRIPAGQLTVSID